MDHDKISQQLIQHLLRSDFKTVKAYIDGFDVRTKVDIDYMIENYEIIEKVSAIKIKLADLVIKQSGVVAIEEDRDRVVFLLAKMANNNFNSVVQAFQSEFGGYFHLSENYQIGNRTHSWKELAEKATQVKNAYRNIDMLRSASFVQSVKVLFENFQETNPTKLQKIADVSDFVVVAIQKRMLDPGGVSEVETVQKQLSELLILTGWPNMEIEKAKSTIDFENYTTFAIEIHYVALLKLRLLKNKLDINNFALVEDLLYRDLAETVAMSYRGDSYLRKGIKLKPVRTT